MSRGGRNLELVLTVLMCASAVAASSALVYREFFNDAGASSTAAAAQVRKAEFWSEALSVSVEPDSDSGLLTLVEFGDFECSFCARFHRVLRAFQTEHPGAVDFRFVHFPLPGHRFAVPAAVAAECAGKNIHRMIDAIYAKQDSLGLRPWSAYATDAGVTDLSAFQRCTVAPQPKRIQQGSTLARRVGIHSTPTVLVNGWLLTVPPSAAELKRMVDSVRLGRELFDAANARP